jgi:ribonuclease BN (tRNA processing enzyme)
VGSGDSFGSGGRFQTCILGDVAGRRFLVDCGASSLVALRAQGIDPNSIEAIVLTHMHGDHCAGVPFLLLDAMLGAKRTAPLVVAGPPGTSPRMEALREALFPGSHVMKPRFPYEYVEVLPREPTDVAGLRVTTYPARHTPETVPTIVRIEVGGKVVAYTGDTDWTDAIYEAAAGADLLVAECYFYDKPVRLHMNYATLREHLPRIGARQVVLTHLAPEMLARVGDVPERCAADGLVVEL